eukprot:UN18901
MPPGSYKNCNYNNSHVVSDLQFHPFFAQSSDQIQEKQDLYYKNALLLKKQGRIEKAKEYFQKCANLRKNSMKTVFALRCIADLETDTTARRKLKKSCNDVLLHINSNVTESSLLKVCSQYEKSRDTRYD